MLNKDKQMVKKKTWDEFRQTGLLWFVNTILHMFGWAIVVSVEKGTAEEAFPARVKYRGFDQGSNTEGYIKVSEYMNEEAERLLQEANE